MHLLIEMHGAPYIWYMMKQMKLIINKSDKLIYNILNMNSLIVSIIKIQFKNPIKSYIIIKESKCILR